MQHSMMPKTLHELEVMLRKEYERGVEDAAVIAQSAVDGMSEGARLNLPANVFHLGLRLPRELLGRATGTQRTFDVLQSIVACLAEGYSVVLEPTTMAHISPPTHGGQVQVVVMNDKGDETKSHDVVVSQIDSMFKLTDILGYSRGRLKGIQSESKRSTSRQQEGSRGASKNSNALPEPGDVTS